MALQPKCPAHAGSASFTGEAGTAASRQLKSLIERIERLEEEKKAIADDIRDVFAEAKGQGFDTKIMRQVIRLRKKDTAERQEEEALLDLYLHALGMAPGEALVTADSYDEPAGRALAAASAGLRGRSRRAGGGAPAGAREATRRARRAGRRRARRRDSAAR